MNATKDCDKKSLIEQELCEILVKAFQTPLLEIRELEIRLTAICNGSVEREFIIMRKEKKVLSRDIRK